MNHKILILLVSTFMFTSCIKEKWIFISPEIHGQLIDSTTDLSIFNAEISIYNGNFKVLSDKDGKFQFDGEKRLVENLIFAPPTLSSIIDVTIYKFRYGILKVPIEYNRRVEYKNKKEYDSIKIDTIDLKIIKLKRN